MSENKEINIVRGIPTGQQKQAATIYYEAFKHKLTPILGTDRERVLDILTTSLQPDYAFTAIREGQVIGLLGFHHDGSQLVDISFNTLVKRFGIFGASWRALLGLVLSRNPRAGELLMDGIAVYAEGRGQGVGTRLFTALFDFAHTAGYNSIRLDVINTNPRARQLYERLGFVEVKVDSVPFLRSMGFTAVTTMSLNLKNGTL